MCRVLTVPGEGEVDITLARGGSGAQGVSVVVPVYNPGPYFERCLASLLRQTLDPSRYELVLVDDGSTDGTAARLDRAAVDHPGTVRVTHIPNSGWPGRPRNLGTDLARFSHVFYCDADDWLPDHALETLLARAEADRSDLVVSRPVGNRRNVPAGVFEGGDYCTTWQQTPGIFSNLTTQKLFRRAFLLEKGLRFSEGRVRLEDFIFMTQAYLQAERISVLGSRPCYVLERRADRGNLTAAGPDEDGHERSVLRIIDVVHAHTAAGPERDLALRRVTTSELLGRISSAAYLSRSDEDRSRLFTQVRRVLDERIPVSVDALLDPTTARRAAAVRLGHRALLEDDLRWATGVTASAELTAASWQSGRLHVGLEVTYREGDEPVRLARRGGSVHLPARETAAQGGELDATEDLARSSAHLALRSRDIGEEWRVPATVTPAPGAVSPDAVELRWRVTAVLDPTRMAGGAPLRAGVWDLHLHMSGCGLPRKLRLGATRSPDLPEPLPAALGSLLVSPFWDSRDHLSLDVDQWARSLGGELARRGVGPATVAGDSVTIPVPLVVEGAPPPLEVHLHPVDRPGTPARTVLGTVAGPPSAVRVEVPLRQWPAGQAWSVHLRCGGPGSGPPAPAGTQLHLPAPDRRGRRTDRQQPDTRRRT